MKLRNITFLMLILLAAAPYMAEAKPKMTKAEQAATDAKKAAFTESFNAAKAKGKDAFEKFMSDTSKQGTQQENDWMTDLYYGEAGTGGKDEKGGGKKGKDEKGKDDQGQGKPPEPKGFMGDPNDPGPMDMSDYLIETDGNGNVTGFKPKDWYDRDTDGDGEVSQEEQRVYESKEQYKNIDKDGDGNVTIDEIHAAEAEMDTDGDGVVSDEERAEWNDKASKERKKKEKNAPGSPGHVPPVADWDKDGDGKPDVGWQRWCWQCVPGDDILNECHSGRPGDCANNGSCSVAEICHPADEEHDGKKYKCHTCEHVTEKADWCREKGYSLDPTCGGCPSGPCVPIDIDISTGQIVPTNESRAKGSTRVCYTCMKVTSVQIRYYVFVVETPFGIVVLDRDKKAELNAIADFDVSSVMGLARTESSAMDTVKSLMGSLGANPLAMLGGSMDLGSLSGLLKQGMDDKRNKYREDCFDDFEKPNFAKREPTSSSEDDIKTAAKNRKKGIEGGPRVEDTQDFGTDPEQAMALDGPIVACGKSGRDKALMVMDSAGNPVAKILQSTLKDNPNAITEALEKAQSLNQNIQGLVAGGPKGLISTLRQKALGAVTKKIQDVVFGKKGDPASPFDPNDQLYKIPEEKKGKLLGIFGGSSPKKTALGGLMKFGSGTLAPGGRNEAEDKFKGMDQWGIQRVGYLPRDDAASAWNIADGEEKNVIVAVVDSGIDLDHPDLPQYIWTNPDEIAGNGIDDDGDGYVDDVHGWNFVDHNNDLTDGRGHGTHVAGIIAAKRNNSIGIAGINPGAVIMSVKVADEEGESDSLKVYQGIQYAVDHGAQVINISLGGLGRSRMLQAAVDHARSLGVFVAVASGNTGEYLGDVAPASANDAFTVGAIDHDGAWSTISSVGPNNALLAPGEAIMSLRSKDSFHKRAIKDPMHKLYFRQSGTSFSAPIVAATASLLLTTNPGLTPDQIEDILLSTATDMGDPGWDGQHGAGLLNATEALKAAGRTDFLTVKLDRIEKNYNKKKRLESVDVYATVRGAFQEFTVGVGKGKRASRFERMAGPFTAAADHAWVARIGQDNLRGSDEWIVNLEVKDQAGNVKTAQALLELE